MYSSKDQDNYLAFTKLLLKDISSGNTADKLKEIELIRKIIRFHEYRYRVLNDALISDYEYDQIFNLLKKIEEDNPDALTADSPTQRILQEDISEFQPAVHLVPMLSLDNSYNAQDLLDFDKRVKEALETEEVTYVLEPKFDGSGISLIYENNLLARAATRGDGTTGEEVTPHARSMPTIPLSAELESEGIQKLEVRGEVVISKANFKKVQDNREREIVESGLKSMRQFKSARNTAAGTFRTKKNIEQEVRKRKLEVFLYHISYAVNKDGRDILGSQLKTHFDSVEMLKKLGFRVPEKEISVHEDIQSLIKRCEQWEEERDNYPFEVDGLVVKVNDLRQQAVCGSTSHHPKWAIAYKFKARMVSTVVNDIEYQVGRTGAITPVAKLQPVDFMGVEISNASLHNADYIAEKDIRIGDTVVVERAGDVIPQIVKVELNKRSGKEQIERFPTECPCCNTTLVKEADEADWRCPNWDCPDQVRERLIHFSSKNAMDIAGLSQKSIEKFCELGYLITVPDIYRLPFDEIQELEGFGSKSVNKLREAIEVSKGQSLDRLLYGLGIRHVGRETAKIFINEIKLLEELGDWPLEKLEELDGVGPIVAKSLFDFFHQESTPGFLADLRSLGFTLEKSEDDSAAPESAALEGKSFLFTGKLTQFSRSEAAEMVKNHSGKMSSSVNKKLDFLVVGEKPGSKLAKAEKLKTVSILTEDQFLEMINS